MCEPSFILESGIKAKFKFDKEIFNLNNMHGSSKITLLNNLLSFDFNLNNKELKIIKSNFRNKNLSFSLDSKIKFNPFFQTDSNIILKEFNYSFVDQINLSKLIKNKNLIKKINRKVIIDYKNTKFFTNLVELHSSDLELAYGRLNFNNTTQIVGGKVNCKGDSIITADYPRLDFECSFFLNDIKKLLKKFSINKKLDKNYINLNIEGSINLINNKINFKKIKTTENYSANKEDIKFFKDKFESIILEDGFFLMFKTKKIKKFILEII